MNAIQALSQLSYTPIFYFVAVSVRQLLYYNTIVSKVKGYFGIFLFVNCKFKLDTQR